MKTKILVALSALTLICTQPAIADEVAGVRELVAEAISLHEEGEYQRAIEIYHQALKVDPESSLVLYELAYSYSALEKYEPCIDAAKRGLERASKYEATLYVIWGTCHSQNGQPKKAVRAFDEGLDKFPDDGLLHFNIAITLRSQENNPKAITHLKRAAEASPDYASPYYILGQIFSTTDHRVPSLFSYMRFIMLEPSTARTQQAAARILELLDQGVEAESLDEITIYIDPDAPKDEGDFSNLEMLLTMNAALRQTGEGNEGKSQADVMTEAIQSFVSASREMSEDYSESFTWHHPAAEIRDLEANGLLKTFSYLIAVRANIEGAQDWLSSHLTELERLGEHLSGKSADEEPKR